MQGSWSDTDLGQTVNINCQEEHILQGSPQRTCNDNGEWNNDVPTCVKQGNLETLRGLRELTELT